MRAVWALSAKRPTALAFFAFPSYQNSTKDSPSGRSASFLGGLRYPTLFRMYSFPALFAIFVSSMGILGIWRLERILVTGFSNEVGKALRINLWRREGDSNPRYSF